jgi:uncharacterized repeat protein (TIGR01451 family)
MADKGKTTSHRLKSGLTIVACALLLSALSYSGMTALSARADSPAYLTPSYLVVIVYDDWDDLQRLAPLDLNLLDRQPDRLAAIVTAQELATLRSKGFDVRVLDAPTTAEPSYYLVTLPPSGETAPLHRHGEVFPYARGAFILKADPAEVELLSIDGFFIQKLLGPIVLPTSPPPTEVDASSILIQEHNPLIQTLVDSVSQTQIYTTILNLQDDDALPGWDASRSRYSYAPELAIERDYIHDRMQALGLDVRYQNFSLGWTPLDNIEGTLSGWGAGSDVVYIVCAHYDSISNDPYNAAPGADDNASGTAAVLEAARVLSHYRYRHTLRFVTFAGEEQGIYGSYYYVAEAHSAGTDIGGAINLDIVAWDSNDDDVMEIHAGTGDDSQDLGIAFLNANATYGISLVPEYITSGATTSSDHVRFWNRGYPAILAIEDFQDFTPYYHQTSDTLDKLDLPYATKFVQATVATLAELSEIIPPGVSVEHTGPDTVMAGTLATLSVQYANPGPDPATGIVITGTLSPGLSYVEDSSGLTVTQPVSGMIVWQVGDLASYTQSSFAVTASAQATLPAGALLTSTVDITGVTTWDDPADNRAIWTGLVPYVRYLPVVFKSND